MDVLQLIRGVRSREPLWDRKHKYYHDRTVTMALWDDVAFLLGVDSETVRTKWKGLRDTFRGELRKLHKTVMSGKPRTSTNWEYFEEMMFVKDQIYSNKRHLEEMVKKAGNVSIAAPITDDSNSCDPHKIADVKAEPPEEEPLENGKSTAGSLILESGKSVTNASENGENPGISERIQYSVQETAETPQNKKVNQELGTSIPGSSSPERALDDEDFNFLMSLLPQMRCLPTTRNLYVRLKIQELLYKEMLITAHIPPTNTSNHN